MRKLILLLLLPIWSWAQTTDTQIKANTNNLIRNASLVTRANHALINDQLTDSKLSALQNNLTSMPTSNNYYINLSWVTSPYQSGLWFPIRFSANNTSAATININGYGAKSIKIGSVSLVSGDIVAGKGYLLYYDGTYFQLIGAGTGGGGGAGTWGTITGTLSDQTDLQAALDAKQDLLVSGTNIKTVGGSSLLGSGNIPVGVGTITSIATSNGISGGTITSAGTISGVNAAADGSTKGVASYTASDFDAASGIISIDYTNGQTANGSTKGFLNSADWNTFNSKESALTFSTGLTRLTNTITVNTSQNISTLSNLTSNGLIKTSGGTGALSIATSGTDYAPATSGTSILKGNGSGGFSNAVSGTDYSLISGTGYPKFSGTTPTFNATIPNADLTNSSITIAGNSTSLGGTVTQDNITGLSSTGIIKRTGANTLAIATSGTDYAPATSGTSILYGNGTGGFSNVTIGSGLTFSTGTLSATGGGGTVTSVSVVSANGLAGSVANATTTPALTLSTTITGMLKGNGTAISAATDGTDYLSPSTIGYSSTALNVNILGQTSKNLQFGANGNVWHTLTTNGLNTFSSANVDASTPSILTVSPGSYTNVTASTENSDIYFGLDRDVQWATGNFNQQRFFRIGQPTMSAIGASTVKYASTFTVDGAPTAGANMTLTNPSSIWSKSGYIESEDESSNTDRNLVLSRYTADANPAKLIFKKSRGTIYSPGGITTNDVVAQLQIAGHDGTQYTYRNAFTWTASGTVASGFLPMDMTINGDISGTGDREMARFRNYGAVVFGGYNSLDEKFRLTNAGGNVFPIFAVDTGSGVGAGTGIAVSANNGLSFTQGNGTRKIESGAIKLLNTTTTAGSEAGGLAFYSQSAGATPVAQLIIMPKGGVLIPTSAGTTSTNSVFQISGNYTGVATNGWLTTGVQAAFDAATFTDPQAGNQTRATATAVSIGQPTFTNSGSATITATDASTFYIANAPTSSNTSTGSFTNTRAWAMTVAAGNVALGGKIFAGGTSTTPTALIHMAAGTATANTAPLKFTSGTNLTTTEAGAVEFDGSQFYATLTNSGTRFQIARVLTNTATLDFGSTSAQNSSDLTITVTGAAVGDAVSLGADNASILSNSSYSAWVSSTNTVTVRFNNYSSGSQDPTSGTFKATVIKN